ncbi:hypothetical protein LOD99_12448 [Oopsacas minuta]|uniref:SH2 domain-containing protein n=1 Tax=Oopsacas minuta TaxID=111878 RepID=A0AAV7JF71_9METZ|nr:hypothetical protein LOD99_12448 [Oopsacas minuta]
MATIESTGLFSGNIIQNDLTQQSLLFESDWYWGNLSKEESAIKLKDKKDGYFLVRNSRQMGEYTLTVRKHGINRLVRILFGQNALYGLNEPLRFSSVVELVEYYRKHSLAEFNSKLDIKLKFPVSRLTSEINKENIYTRLHDIQLEIKEKNNLFKIVEDEFINTRICYDEMCLLYSSQLLLTDLLKEHQNCMKTFIKTGVYPELLSINKAIFDTLFLSEIGYLSELDSKLDSLKRRDSEYEIKISLLRSELNCLFNQREEYTNFLVENGASEDELKSKFVEFNLDEEIYGGTVEALNLLTCLPFPSSLWLATEELDKLSTQHLFDDRGKSDGSFLVRPSNDASNLSHVYTLEVMFKSRRYRIKIFNILGAYQLEKGPTFPNLQILIQHYSTTSLKDYKQILDTTLKIPIL